MFKNPPAFIARKRWKIMVYRMAKLV